MARQAMPNRHISHLASLFLQLLRDDGTLIDLGANIGTVCLPVAAAGRRVIAVEMNPRNVLKLTLAALVNGFPNLRVVQAAVNDADSVVGPVGDATWGQVSNAADAQQAVGLQLDSILRM